MRGAGSFARIMIVGIVVAGGLSVSTPVSAHLFDAGQRRHVIDCLFWLLTDPASQAANCQARAATTETIGSAGDTAPAGSDPASSGGGAGDANTGDYSPGSDTGFFNDGSGNTGTYTPDQNSGSFNDGGNNAAPYN